MTQSDSDVQSFQEYRGDNNIRSIVGALLLKLNNDGVGNSGGGNTEKLTPTLTVVDNRSGGQFVSNTISNAKHISIVVQQGTGSVLGATVDTVVSEINLPLVEQGWEDVTYTVNPGGLFVILVGL